MLFHTPAYFIFFGVYFLLSLVVPEKWRLIYIVVGSTIFYGYWNYAYVWLPYFLMIGAHLGLLWIDSTNDPVHRKRRLLVILVLLLLPLCFFKYSNFIADDVFGPLFGFSGQIQSLPLPLGISFITFTMIAYVVEAYRHVFPVERRLSMLGAYTLFFPHLIAGPILRPGELIPRLEMARKVARRRYVIGIVIFTVGLGKKLLIADQLIPAIDRVYINAQGLVAWDYLLAIFGFTAQIYYDFSAYTDMAIGSAILLGIQLPQNFHRPYEAASIIEFWRRWHMTLSRWLRDFLYIPLGGNRRGVPRQTINIMITMGLGGLWHGASWTFLLWGLMHGGAVVVNHLIRDHGWFAWVGRLPTWVKVLVTFNFVTFAWILFRAGNLATFSRVVTGPFVLAYTDVGSFLSDNGFVIAVLVLAFSLHKFDDHRRFSLFVRRGNPILLWASIFTVWLLAIAVGPEITARFIYFEF